MRKSALITGTAILVLLFCVGVVWYAAWREDRRGTLTVSFLSVGEGDALFIEAPSGRTMLVDGGPDAGVLRELSEVSPWYDRSIDVVVATEPDPAHVTGLVDVLERYNVAYILRSSVLSSAPAENSFEAAVAAVQKNGTNVVTAQRGEVVDLGSGAYLEVLAPDRLVPNVEASAGCVVARLVYGTTSFMFPCDAPQSVENYLAQLDGSALKSDVLQVGHSGSNTSSSPLFVGFVSPEYAVYSRGCDTKFAPSPETVATFAKFDIPTLDTCTDGTVTFVSDGQTVVREN